MCSSQITQSSPYASVPPAIIVDVDDAVRASRETCLDEGIIFGHVGLV
jgi:hypothetical protein